MELKEIEPTEAEIKELLSFPLSASHLADYHSQQETMADAMDYEDPANYHKERAAYWTDQALKLDAARMERGYESVLARVSVAPQDEVGAALSELKEMFPDSVCEIKASQGNESALLLISARAGGLRTPHYVSANTLAEAMQKVRDWKRENS